MSQLTQGQRYEIAALLQSGKKANAIAKQIGKCKSVISRELKRNCDRRSGEYKSELAQRKYEERMSKKNKRKDFSIEMIRALKQGLEQEYSPEQIKGLADKHEVKMVSHERLYQHIWEDKKSGGQLYTHLRRKGRKYRKRGASKDSRGILTNRRSIESRPKKVNERATFGDLEIDTVIGKNHKGALVTINDRKTGMCKIAKVETREAECVLEAVKIMLDDWRPFIRTITADNGKEFACHEQIAAEFSIDFYFANPYHPWERGSNENLNGLIRQYIPKKTDLSTIDQNSINQIELKLNHRPRKRFMFNSPIFEMESELFNQKVAFVT